MICIASSSRRSSKQRCKPDAHTVEVSQRNGKVLRHQRKHRQAQRQRRKQKRQPRLFSAPDGRPHREKAHRAQPRSIPQKRRRGQLPQRRVQQPGRNHAATAFSNTTKSPSSRPDTASEASPRRQQSRSRSVFAGADKPVFRLPPEASLRRFRKPPPALSASANPVRFFRAPSC